MYFCKEEVAQESLIKFLVHVECVGHSPKNWSHENKRETSAIRGQVLSISAKPYFPYIYILILCVVFPLTILLIIFNLLTRFSWKIAHHLFLSLCGFAFHNLTQMSFELDIQWIQSYHILVSAYYIFQRHFRVKVMGRVVVKIIWPLGENSNYGHISIQGFLLKL